MKTNIKQEKKVVELSKLVPYDKNPNIHPEEQVKALAESMDEYGQYYPIIDGFHRWLVSGREPLKTMLGNKIPVVIVAHANREDDMAGTITFNRARGTHLLEPMENIVKSLIKEGVSVADISKKLGMSDEEIFRLSKLDRQTFLQMITDRKQTFSKAVIIRKG